MGKNARKHARRRKWYKDLQEQPCHYCGTSPGGTVDHKKPLSKGGTPLPINSVPSCEPCNARKGSISYGKFILTLRESR